jgi:hypothetical protein
MNTRKWSRSMLANAHQLNVLGPTQPRVFELVVLRDVSERPSQDADGLPGVILIEVRSIGGFISVSYLLVLQKNSSMDTIQKSN